MAKDDDKKPAKGGNKGRKRKSAYKLDETSKKKEKKAAADTGHETPEDAAAEDTAADDNVVDLDEAREAQGDEPGLLDGLGDHLRNSVRQYLVDNVVPDGQSSGTMNVDVDAAFLKEHGPKLIGSIAQSLFKAVVPSKLEMSVPLDKPASEEEAEESGEAEATPTEDEGKVSVNVDLGNFFKGLFAAPATTETEEPPDEDDDKQE